MNTFIETPAQTNSELPSRAEIEYRLMKIQERIDHLGTKYSDGCLRRILEKRKNQLLDQLIQVLTLYSDRVGLAREGSSVAHQSLMSTT